MDSLCRVERLTWWNEISEKCWFFPVKKYSCISTRHNLHNSTLIRYMYNLKSTANKHWTSLIEILSWLAESWILLHKKNSWQISYYKNSWLEWMPVLNTVLLVTFRLLASSSSIYFAQGQHEYSEITCIHKTHRQAHT